MKPEAEKKETKPVIRRPSQSGWQNIKPVISRSSQSGRREVQSSRPKVELRVDFTYSRIAGIRETTRTEESIGEETRIFDQSQTTASAVETMGLSHTAEWASTVDTTRARTFGGSAGLSIAILGIASLQGKMENSLSVRYSSSWKQSITREQSTAITIPAGKKVRVTVRWKRIWQEGVIVLRSPSGPRAYVPFRVTVMLAFDKETVDLK
jgi:hypothetical protein